MGWWPWSKRVRSAVRFIRAKFDSAQTTPEKGYQVDFGRGPVLLDLEAGDRAEFLESRSPST